MVTLPVIRYNGIMRQVSIYPLLLVNFIGTLGFSIIIPFLVFLIEKFGGNAIIYGIASATYPLFQLIGAPVLGRWSDIYGRKKILLLSQSGTFLSWIIFLSALFIPVKELLNIDTAILGRFTLTVPLIIIFIARSLDGLTGGNISVANAYLSDITEEKERSSNFGKMSVSSNLGFILGPALAGLLGATVLAEVLPVLVALLISGIAIVIIKFYLPESIISDMDKNAENGSVRKVFGQEHKECYKLKSRQALKLNDILKLKNIPFLLVLYFLIFLGFNIFYAAFPVHAIKHLKWSVTQMGVFFSILSLMMIVVQGPVLSRLSKKISDQWLTITGSIILAINFLILIKGDFVLTYVAAVFFAVGNGIMWPSFLSILSITAGEKYQGTVQGFASSAGSLASIIGLIIGGILYEKIGSMAFLIAALVILVVFSMSFWIRSSGSKSPGPGLDS